MSTSEMQCTDMYSAFDAIKVMHYVRKHNALMLSRMITLPDDNDVMVQTAEYSMSSKIVLVH